MKSFLPGVSTVLFVAHLYGAEPEPEVADLKPEILRHDPFTWPDGIPDDCPFERSNSFNSVRLLGVKSGFRDGDTWNHVPRKFLMCVTDGSNLSERNFPVAVYNAGRFKP